jgi:hypothetical protein
MFTAFFAFKELFVGNTGVYEVLLYNACFELCLILCLFVWIYFNVMNLILCFIELY